MLPHHNYATSVGNTCDVDSSIEREFLNAPSTSTTAVCHSHTEVQTVLVISQHANNYLHFATQRKESRCPLVPAAGHLVYSVYDSLAGTVQYLNSRL